MRASSLFTGALGVKAHNMALTSVADNIANVSTTGFKGTRALFNTLICRQLVQCGRDSENTAGYVESHQIGLGVACKPMNVMTAASLASTGLNTDLGIDGQGFFIVKASASTYSSPFGTIVDNAMGSKPNSPNYYTRAGEFHVDRNGYIVNPQQYVLQGVMANAEGRVLMGPIEDLRIPSDKLAGKFTSAVEMGVNLDAADNRVHPDSQAIDPNDSTTYNYSTAAVVYDHAGQAHNLIMLYQRVEPMSSRSWKVSMFEKTSAGYVNPGDNQFRLNFDDKGNLSLINNPTAERWLASLGVGANQLISSQMGESLNYAGASGPQQYLSPSVLSFHNATSGGETVTIGATTYSLGVNATAAEAAGELVRLINQDTATAGCFAVDEGSGRISLHPLTASPLNVTANAGVATVQVGATLDQVVKAVNNGQASGGTIMLNNLLAAGEVVSIGAQSYTVPSAASLSDMASQLADLINKGGIYQAKVQGEGVYVSAKDTGKSGNVAFSSTDIGGNISMSAASLLGGLDGSSVSMIDAQVETDPATGLQKLALQRIGAGPGATITGLSSSFSTSAGALAFSQTQVAGNTINITDGLVPLNLILDGQAQPVTLNFIPNRGWPSTQQAQNSTLNHYAQNGYPPGEVNGLDIDKNGNVWVEYTNDQIQLVGTIALAHFRSPWDLDRFGDNLWLATQASGEALIDLPNTETYSLGSVIAFSLEKSNVDMGQEMVNMINYQRAYQFNTKSITTTDEMLKIAINMKH